MLVELSAPDSGTFLLAPEISLTTHPKDPWVLTKVFHKNEIHLNRLAIALTDANIWNKLSDE